MRSNFDFKTKNQLNENVRRLREIQRNCKKRQEEKQEPVKVLWKSEKYSCVESKIKQDIEKPVSSRPSSANFLRAHSRAGPPVKLESRPVTPDITNKTSVPPASTAQNVTLIRHNWDFIKVNGINAKKASLNRPHSLTALDDSKKRQEDLLNNYHFGEVPSYLQKRKQEWRHEEDQRIANTPDPSMPPGHRQLPENERKETLELLLAKQKDVVTQIQKLPIGADTIRVKQQRQSLEKQLTEVEEAIKIFSRPKVFVRVES
ncbi:enkurin domain-containing protein 1 [Biomphalaria glabrata]|uniref:Enkurin domain-containing protein 1-like n=1 Tax=Biomphalaria glabrata TaxID=6526 RepID=A0A9W2ZN60_BIOGL|nr:enkurin domain-containing protein 1-like [Biomphalaria glabrata]XP_055876340.1 enkurin domain-containing protein 1-like [Biomphalaria glabrata]KAI8765556.1 enkurin domain-containing protein 1-like [Biomphalaria glabrata]